MDLVKWIDHDGGGRTGRRLEDPDGHWLVVRGMQLVKESCDGRLTWVPVKSLQPWPMRDEWEAAE